MIFDERTISNDSLNILLESAVLAASSHNAQPWRFIYAMKGTEGYETLRSLLSEYNQDWTMTAPVLMLAIAQQVDEKGRSNYYALHDLGQAVSSMAIQASLMGIQIHQMGGYDQLQSRVLLQIPENFVPGSMIALGYPGDKSLLEGRYKDRANEPRKRFSLTEASGGVDFFNK
jgi:nitroreductase